MAVFIAPPDAEPDAGGFHSRCRSTAQLRGSRGHCRRRARALTATATAANRPRWWRSSNSRGKAGVGRRMRPRRTVVDDVDGDADPGRRRRTGRQAGCAASPRPHAPPTRPHHAHSGSTNSAGQGRPRPAPRTTLRRSPSERQRGPRGRSPVESRRPAAWPVGTPGRWRRTPPPRSGRWRALSGALRRPADPHRDGPSCGGIHQPLNPPATSCGGPSDPSAVRADHDGWWPSPTISQQPSGSCSTVIVRLSRSLSTHRGTRSGRRPGERPASATSPARTRRSTCSPLRRLCLSGDPIATGGQCHRRRRTSPRQRLAGEGVGDGSG